MTRAAVTVLAEYLTGPMVGFHSIGLQIGGHQKEHAGKAFFAMRSAFGVSGYASVDEAVTSINEALGLPSPCPDPWHQSVETIVGCPKCGMKA